MATKVWIISELYYPEESATGHYMTGIAECLAKDYEVHAICSQPSYLARGVRAPQFEIHQGVRIHRVPSTTFDKDKLPLRFLNVLTLSLSIFVSVLSRVGRRDVVVVVTNPPTLPYFVALASFLRGARMALRVDDVYPNALEAASSVKSSSFVYSLMDRTTRLLYSYASAITVLGRDMQTLVQSKLSKNREKVRIITNWSDTEKVRPLLRSANKLRKELKLEDKFVVQCAGNIGRGQGIECLFLAAEKLKERQDIHFLFIGSGAKRDWLINEIRIKHLTNITVLSSRPRSDQIEFLNTCDLGICSLIPGMLGIAVPSRVYNILAAGKPILAVVDPRSEIGMLVREERVGWVVPPMNLDGVVDAVLSAHSNPEALAAMGGRARQVAEETYCQDRVLESYKELVKDLEGRN